MTLEDILIEYFGLPKLYGDVEWIEAYNRLVRCVYYIGALTEHNRSASEMIAVIDKIDTQDGEI